MTRILAHWLYLLTAETWRTSGSGLTVRWSVAAAVFVRGVRDGRHAQGVSYRQSCQIQSRPSFRPALVSWWNQTHVGKPNLPVGWSSMLCSLTGDHQNHSLWLYLEICIRRLFPLSPQLQVTLASLAWCQKWGECAKSCARRSISVCSQSGGGANIGLLT
jgi:hypothetical protein